MGRDMDYESIVKRLAEKREDWKNFFAAGLSLAGMLENENYDIALWIPDSANFLDDSLIALADLARKRCCVKYYIADPGNVNLAACSALLETEVVSPVDVASLTELDFIITVSRNDCLRAARLDTNADVVELYDLGDIEYTKLKHRTYCSYANFEREHGVHLYMLQWVELKNFISAADFSEEYRQLLSRSELQKNPEHLRLLYDDIEEYSSGYIRQLFAEIPIIKEGETIKHIDHRSAFLNVVGGKRFTMNQPLSRDRTCHVFGACLGFGYGADDRYTIGSLLQGRLNDHFAEHGGERWRVVTHGIWGGNLSIAECGMRVIRGIENGEITAGDAVVDVSFVPFHYVSRKRQSRVISHLEGYYHSELGITVIDLYELLKATRKKHEVFIDRTHVNHRGYGAIAEMLFNDYLVKLPPKREDSFDSLDFAVEPSVTYQKRWGELNRENHSPLALFNAVSARRVALYAFDSTDSFCNRLIAEFLEFGIQIIAIAASNSAAVPIRRYNDIPLFYPDDIDEGIPEVDVILSMRNLTEEETKILRKKLKTEVLTVEELVSLVYDRYATMEPAIDAMRASSASKCLLAWSALSELGGDVGIVELETLKNVADKLKAMGSEWNYFSGLYGDLKEFSIQYIQDIWDLRRGAKGRFLQRDQQGVRHTCEQPLQPLGKIHIFGGGPVFGWGTDDRYTIASCLQVYVNKRDPGDAGSYAVLNRALCGEEEPDAGTFAHCAKAVRGGEIAEDDAILLMIHPTYHQRYARINKVAEEYIRSYLEKEGVVYVDLAPALRISQEKSPTFVCDSYVNHRGYKACATKIYFDYLKRFLDGDDDILRLRRAAALSRDRGLAGDLDGPLKSYLDYLSGKKLEKVERVGCIVMNCNPFTKGHRYLVERAVAEVDALYVFVVEEDMSYFKFEDRFRLVSSGLADLQNVKVLRSGKFIISTLTFPGYFDKDSAKEVRIDVSLDLDLFVRHIVPALDIRVRFVGNEPLCPLTRQYNNAMRETLPRHGVQFVEFERVESGDEPISASRVRALLEVGNFDEIQKIVPRTTYDFLVENFARENS